ncbi:hypothetical protein JH06_4905 [Blastocystis sp. subtype 4]|uniref:hypothetical protein n=1 Tax=Blastocystis sp. subtype 4 TaxID=944170 RepID=UPI0007120907|nr:hypothetical protein JH06_4905 [Blastocystis sp. subtype 4]KNB41725.1 hypothetical protein JH06_4905 [Blastocystis sp. subtype 4]|eukprot:XP_014525168.1 hypothetical protein JH06_4905 [Blastocystis sp. subtype 4]
MPEDHSKRSRIRSRSAGHTGHSDQLSLDSGEVLSESSRSNHPVFRGSNIPEVNGLISKVIDYICNLLRNSQNYKLKAVELGNRVRDTFGTDLLSGIREKYLGLLNMLEKYPQYFVVTRIPKSDFVSLAPEVITNLSGEKGSLYPEGDTQPSSLSGRAVKLTTVSRCLHVGNVGLHASEESLRIEFGQFGEIEDVKIVHQGERRYAFVYFVKSEEAEVARSTLTKQPKWKGNISFAKKEKDISERRSKIIVSMNTLQPSRHLWLGNINTRTVSVNELRNLFESFGPIENINILYEKNCVFIDFYEEASAIAAQHRMQGVMIGGNLIELGYGKCERPNQISVVQLTSEDAEILLVIFSCR